MKRIFYLFLVFSFLNCTKDDEVVQNPVNPPIPEGAKEVTVIVDEPYDLSDSEAFSIVGSSSMNGQTNKIAIPRNFRSAIFFLEDDTQDVLAVVHSYPSSSLIQVNANTVAQALMNLVPAYHSLSLKDRDKFEEEIPEVPIYLNFVATVDKLLKNGKSVYSDDPEFIEQLLNLHNYINSVYLGISEPSNNSPNNSNISSQGNSKQVEGELTFSNWMSPEGGGIVTNNVYSYALVQFEPHSSGEEMKSSLLKPNPFSGEKTTLTLSKLELEDDCYNVKITQSHNDAKSQNLLGAATTFTELFLKVVLDFAHNKNCFEAIAASLVPKISSTAMEAANLTSWEMVDRVGSVAWAGTKTFITSKSCHGFLNPEKVAAALGKQAVVALKVYKALELAQKTVKLSFYLKAVINPLEISEIIQIYYKDLREACVRVSQNGELDEEYESGETIYPEVKIEAQSYYANWEKSGFKVDWKVETGNGSVNLPRGETDNEGKARVGWKLPENLSGEVTLIAELVDREGDHLSGSPIIFNTTVKSELEGSQRLFSVVYEDGVVRLVELDIANFGRLGTIATFNHMLQGGTFNEETSQIYFHRDNSNEIIKVNVITGVITSFNDAGNYGSLLFLNKRLFTEVYEDGVVKLIELNRNDLSRIKTVATLDYGFGGVAFNEETNEIFGKRSYSYDFIKINIDTGVVTVHNVAGNYGAPLIFNNRLFSVVYEDGVVRLVELSMNNFSRIKTIATFHYLLEGGTFNEETNEIYFKRNNSYEFIKININTGELTSYNILGNYGAPLIFKVFPQSEN